MTRLSSFMTRFLDSSMGEEADATRQQRRHAGRITRRRGPERLAESIESLERRSMLSANALDVTKVLWNGQRVDAVRNEYVFRMPQTNVAMAKSAIDYQCVTPAVQAGWSLQSLGTGFFKLVAPGATQTTLTNWSRQVGASYLSVNRVGEYAKTPSDPLYSDSANWAFPKIQAAAAWDTGTGTSTTIVAVMDSGVDYRHPDLAANMWQNPNDTAGDGVDNDQNGYVDDVYGINAATGSSDPMDRYGHGTFCAGLIGAVGDNATGMVGVNWSVQIMALSIGDAAPTESGAIVAANYIVNQKIAGQNIAAVNCSFSVGFSQALDDSFRLMGASGIVVVCAAGNDSSNNDLVPVYPANLEIPQVISVAATQQDDSLADFSNYGVRTVDLGAPGVDVLSTRLVGGGVGNPLAGNNRYGTDSGTSFAAPLVAGTAGLLKSLKPAASADQIKKAILDGVDKVASLSGVTLTGGRLNVKNAVDLVLSTQGTVPVASFATGQSVQFLEGNTGYTYADVKITLDRPPDPGKSAAVWYETRPGGSAISGIDFVAQSGFVTFSGSEMEKTFRIKIIADRLVEQSEQFAIRLDAAKSRGVAVGTAQTNVVILDDDNATAPVQPAPTNPGLVPRVSIDVKKQQAPNDPTKQVPVPIREGGVATFVVSLDKTSNKVVTVKYRTNQPTLVPAGTALQGLDYVATSGTLTFRPGESTKEFTVPILADRVADANETFHVVLTEPINADLAGGSGGGGSGVSTGAAVTATITDVPYIPPPAPGFQITVSFPDSSLTTTQQAVFQQAANRWQQIIVGDLPNVTDPVTGQVIDDILIVATAPTIDGVGNILGGARPTDYRTGTRGLPWKGVMQFDTADIAALEADGTLTSVILHEMGHALGFGAVWQQFGLVQRLGTTNPIYVGANALREYRSIFALPNATGVPVENAGGQGTAGAHWRESVFATELMTGYAERAGVSMPISRITVGQFEDLGYRVDYAKADAFTKPALRASPSPAAGSPPSNVRGSLVRSLAPIAESVLASDVESTRPARPSVRAFASMSSFGSRVYS